MAGAGRQGSAGLSEASGPGGDRDTGQRASGRAPGLPGSGQWPQERKAGRGTVGNRAQDLAEGADWSILPASGWTRSGQPVLGAPLKAEASLPLAGPGPASKLAPHLAGKVQHLCSPSVKRSICFHPGSSLSLPAGLT